MKNTAKRWKLKEHDVILEENDLVSLNDGEYITDKILILWSSWIEKTILNDDSSILTIQPNLAYLLMSTSSCVPSASFLGPLDLSSRNIIIVPLPSEDGNSHWSLLVVVVPLGKAYFYDSMFSSSTLSYEAKTICDIVSSELKTKHLDLERVQGIPRQENSSDCGIFVCMYMEALMTAIVNIRHRLETTKRGSGGSNYEIWSSVFPGVEILQRNVFQEKASEIRDRIRSIIQAGAK